MLGGKFAGGCLAHVIILSVAWISLPAIQVPRTFDAATIKRSLPDAPVAERIDPGHLALHNVSLIGLIEIAYGLNAYQVQAPRWMQDEDFSVDAETEHPATKQQMAAMLKLLLVRQFGLVVHPAARVEKVYSLRVAPNGFRLRPEPNAGSGQPSAELQSYHDGDTVLLELRSRCNLEFFANALGPFVDRPIVNETGISGTYKFDLKFAPKLKAANLAPGATSLAGTPLSGQSLFAALSDQLGLKLTAGKGLITVLVVDYASKLPVGN